MLMRTLIGVLAALIPLGFILVMMVQSFAWPAGREVFDGLRLLLGVLGILMTIGFISNTFRSDSVPRAKRGLWVTVLVLGNIFALPFYWFWYIRRPIRPGRAHS
jgi:hypothetical protein